MEIGLADLPLAYRLLRCGNLARVRDQVATTGFYDDEPSVQMPPALLLRVARILETGADLVEAGLVGYEADPDQSAGLHSAFRRDVDLLRTMASQEQQ